MNILRYVGHEKTNDEQGSDIPSFIANRAYFGATHLLDCIGNQINMTQDLTKVFGAKTARKIQSLSYFLVLKGESSMYRFDKFARTHTHPYGKSIPSQRISDIFASINERDKTLFFKLRA